MGQGVQDYANVKMENAVLLMVLAGVILDGKVLLTVSLKSLYIHSCLLLCVGVYCDSLCDYGYWGPSCSTKCGCNGGSCASSSGTCSCLAGYMGSQCLQSKLYKHIGKIVPCNFFLTLLRTSLPVSLLVCLSICLYVHVQLF